ncbi:uncharacterized protein LOC123695165 [Colias croceus]|uniref:uncharacterized protein LOC123695165 n=1 Tax=Colias crocea TaxID=72248 RepID=UPI001E27FACE|nr:uncharacterized protein LOC123695165 [Colias croceus]
MVKSYLDIGSRNNHVKADIIIVGCSLPGIVTAHKLKKKFGDSMDIVVLDLAGTRKGSSKCNVAFQDDTEEETKEFIYEGTAKEIIDNVARYYLAMYSKEFNIPLPDALVSPDFVDTNLNKLVECSNGNVVACAKNFCDFDYLNFLERFELNQYQTLLDQNMKNLFHANKFDDESERRTLFYYDHTTMEEHLCEALIFNASRDIMRITVRLVCGTTADAVSVLFYLHQCYRTSSARNHIDGDNTRLREKLLGFCRKRLTSKLQQSVASITYPAKTIKEIRTHSDEEVILKISKIKGEMSYTCNLLAMALRPDELKNIKMGSELVSDCEIQMASSMKQGKARKFVIQYEEHFWREYGFSGDILSLRGPIIWATERPKMSTNGSQEKYAALVGYLKVTDGSENSKDAVIAQLIRLFGDEAASVVNYKETDIEDVFVPRCGDYVAIRTLTNKLSSRFLEWGALDIFAEGDVAAALEAGHTAYLHLLRCLRPQAQTYEDVSIAEWPTLFTENVVTKWLAGFNLRTSVRVTFYTTVFFLGLRMVHSFMRK